MGFLERAIRRGVSDAVGKAVEKGVRQAVEPKIEQAAATAVNSAANQINQAAGGQNQPQTAPQSTVNQAEVNQAASTLGGLFGGLTGAATTFANEAAKNMKICPACGEGAGKDVKFCPKCGGKMPEETVAQGAVCPSCHKQNSIGTKFCSDCGTKLPSAVQEEQAAQAQDAQVMAEWDEMLSEYPKWNCGGADYRIESFDGQLWFCANFPDHYSAKSAVRQYVEFLLQNGFHQAGQYPNIENLYKETDGICYHVNTEMCFEANECCPTIYFDSEEPVGGVNYTKPEPKKQTSFKDLFKF